jgi:glycine/D-amino acid oxidase-like deaminating enzyme
MARQAVRAVVTAARERGVTYQEETILTSEYRGKGQWETGKGEQDTRSVDSGATSGKLESLATLSGGEIFAKQFVFACGPWLPKLFPALLGQLIQITRQEVFFFGVPAGDRFGPERMPAWIDFTDLVYGIPNLDNRGFKIAIDAHGPEFDPDTGDRIASNGSLTAVRAQLAERLPELAEAPITETRVCQYENTSNGDFLIDRHPWFDNVWLAGGGSGHGFKHGPAIGEHVAGLLSGDVKVEQRFSLATKATVQQRKVY